MTHAVLVPTTRMLSGEFYESLARGRGIATALDDARTYLANNPEKYEVRHGDRRKMLELDDWFLPALFERAVFVDYSQVQAEDARSVAVSTIGSALERSLIDTDAATEALCETPTLVSPDDQAVFLSQWKHRHRRVGYVPPVTVVDGIKTIEVGGFGLLDLGHGYFASAGPVIQNIREAIEKKDWDERSRRSSV